MYICIYNNIQYISAYDNVCVYTYIYIHIHIYIYIYIYTHTHDEKAEKYPEGQGT